MNVHISYKINKTSDLEKLINRQTEKLGRYLQVFRPDLVHLKGIVEGNSAREGFVVSLNLRLPSGQMVAQESSTTATSAIKAAFDAITEQLKKHKELLRSHHKWPGRRAPRRAVVATVPFEETLAAVKPNTISACDISGYINVNLPRLKRFIERALDFRVSDGQILPDQIAVQDVLAEAIADALGDQYEKPERVKLEAWLYRLASEAVDRLAWEGREEAQVPLERSHGQQNVQASDEAVLQFHQPDEKLVEEDVIPDPTANNPEELAARHELISLVETILREAGHHEQEAFILYTIEGFTVEEIGDITKRSVEEVRAYIRKAREHLQRALPIKDPLKDRLVELSRSA
jgi:RNA polymerase sigma factor (sigma-70 family)